MMKPQFMFTLLGLALVVGCGGDESAEHGDSAADSAAVATVAQPKVVNADNGTSPALMEPAVAPPPPPVVNVGDSSSGEGVIAPPPPAPATEQNQGESLPTSEGFELVQAVVGVGKEGRYDSDDYISTVVSARFRAAQKIELAKIPRAMQIYKVQSRDQKGPKSHEEFMKKIIEENLIQLPELPDGEQYRYVPEKETLFVARPKK